MEYDPNYRTFKHVDKFAARGMVKEIQRDAAKAESEWEMQRAQRREYEKDMPKDNDYFRKMYMNRDEVAEPEMTRWVDRVKKPGDAFMQAAKKAQRREKKDIYAALQKEHTEREAELANKYRDRAAERRDGTAGVDDNAFGSKFSADGFKTTGERKQQLIEQSKYLGGDLAHTHLVKGLDYALLQKIRAEQARKEEEDMKVQEEILDAKTKSDRKLEDKEDLTQVRHPLAKNVHRVLFETEMPKKVDNFLEGRMAYVFELDDEYAESDIPTTLMRSKADCPDMQDNLSQSQNDVVLQKLTQILSYIRTGNKKKNKKQKMDFDLEKGVSEDEADVKQEPKDDGFKIFSSDEEGGKEDKRSRRSKKERRRRSRSRSNERTKRKERKRSRSRDRRDRNKDDKDKRRRKDEKGRKRSEEEREKESGKPKYFDDLETEEKMTSDVSISDIHKMAAKYDKKKTVVDKTGKDGISFGDVPDSYAECYPSMQYEVAGVTNDSDDEADVTKMDLGKSGKGPMNRFDFENEEDYGDYMSKREALPKAAFQYGQKNVDRSSLTKSKHADRKNDKQKLDQQFQKIQQIMKKRDEKKGKGNSEY